MFHIDGQAPEAPEERYAGYGLRSARQAYRHKYATCYCGRAAFQPNLFVIDQTSSIGFLQDLLGKLQIGYALLGHIFFERLPGKFKRKLKALDHAIANRFHVVLLIILHGGLQAGNGAEEITSFGLTRTHRESPHLV